MARGCLVVAGTVSMVQKLATVVKSPRSASGTNSRSNDGS